MICRNGWRSSLIILWQKCLKWRPPSSTSREPLPSKPLMKLVSGKPLHFHALPERPTLRSMEEDQDYKGSWQKNALVIKLHRAENFGRFDYSRSQSSQSRLRISKQSPVCSRGTRFGYSMVAIASVQNKILTGNRQKRAKVSRTEFL